jgi:arginine-tRNA-protein transferase
MNLDALVPLGTTPPHRCPYLGDRDASLSFYLPIFPAPEDFDAILQRGLRRHGALFYQPQCPGGCRECVPIRVLTGAFRPSRSQRRLLRRFSSAYTVDAVEPRSAPELVDLFNRHARHVSTEATALGEEEYRDFLIESRVAGVQFEFRIEGRLAAVSYLDLGRAAASSIYCFWDPERRGFSPGTFSALCEIDWCRRQGYRHYYLGYWVRDCRSMAYKSRFQPHEFLDWESGEWRPGKNARAPSRGRE